MTALEVVDRKWYVNLTEREKIAGKKQRPKISQAMVFFSCGLQLKKDLFAGRVTKADCRVCGEAICSKTLCGNFRRKTPNLLPKNGKQTMRVCDFHH